MTISFICTMLMFHYMHVSRAITNYSVNLESKTLPRTARSMVPAYNGAGSILLLGGRPDAQQFMTFYISSKYFNTYSTSYFDYSQNIYSYSQNYYDLNDGLLWIIGGQSNLLSFDTSTYALDSDIDIPDSYNWFTTYSCLARVGNLLFVLGGISSSPSSDVTLGGMKTGKIYNFVSTVWYSSPLFNELRARFACIVTPNDELYAIAGGGIDTHSISRRFTNYFSSIEKLNVSYNNLGNVLSQTAEWEMIPNALRQPLAGTRAVLYLDEIIVLGGFNGVTEVTDISCINYNTDDVRICGELGAALLDVTAIVVDRTLHVFGGSYGTTSSGWQYSNYYQTISLPTSSAPTKTPLSQATEAPSSRSPSSAPSEPPTLQPSSAPSLDPTRAPSIDPTQMPSHSPSKTPSKAPTLHPSLDPSSFPSLNPSKAPSLTPTFAPSDTPETTSEENEDELSTDSEMVDNLIALGFASVIVWFLLLVFCWWNRKRKRAKVEETDALADHVADNEEDVNVPKVQMDDEAQVNVDEGGDDDGGEESVSEPKEGAGDEVTGNQVARVTTKGDESIDLDVVDPDV